MACVVPQSLYYYHNFTQQGTIKHSTKALEAIYEEIQYISKQTSTKQS